MISSIKVVHFLVRVYVSEHFIKVSSHSTKHKCLKKYQNFLQLKHNVLSPSQLLCSIHCLTNSDCGGFCFNKDAEECSTYTSYSESNFFVVILKCESFSGLLTVHIFLFHKDSRLFSFMYLKGNKVFSGSYHAAQVIKLQK